MPAKICTRCGAQYANLRSATCPQCFARLLVVDDATATELSAIREAEERTPEFQDAKAADDERFRHESFGACLGVLGIIIITALVCTGLLISASHRHHIRGHAPAQADMQSTDLLAAGPEADAPIDAVLPNALPSFVRISAGSSVNLPGTLTPVYSAEYASALSAPGHPPLGEGRAEEGSGAQAVNVFAVPTGLPTAETNQFELSVTLAAQIGGSSPRPTFFFATEHWWYGVVGRTGDAASAEQLRLAFASAFSQRR